jgi:uncharacterized protein (DUF2237 family)
MLRWQEAMEDGVAPLVDLALEFVLIDVLNRYATSI